MIKSYRKKVRHYRNTQKEQFMVSNAARKIFNPSLVPNKLNKYGDLSVFKTPSDLPAPIKSLGPFICDSKIKVLTSEMLICRRIQNLVYDLSLIIKIFRLRSRKCQESIGTETKITVLPRRRKRTVFSKFLWMIV